MKFKYLSQNYTKTDLLNLEWLDVNGVGGYASSSILGCNRRKYHGLLVSVLSQYADKQVLLSKIDDAIIVQNSMHFKTSNEINNTKAYYLSASQYLGYDDLSVVDILHNFALETHPKFSYIIEDKFVVEKEIALIDGKNTVLMKYTIYVKNYQEAIKAIETTEKLTLKLCPLFAYRSFHGLSKENSFIQKNLHEINVNYIDNKNHNNAWQMSFYANMPDFYINSSANIKPTIDVNYDWYRKFVYQCEQERGYPSQEDLFAPCNLNFDIEFNKNSDAVQEIILAFSLENISQNLEDVWNSEIQRRLQQQTQCTGNELQKHLQQVALSFLHYEDINKNSCGIVAGYHWFLDWGRDAMIALPGLTLFNNHENVCALILKTFALHIKNGLVPNFIGKDKSSNAYNSVDASLWFVWATQQLYYKTKDIEILHELLPALIDIFTHFKHGTDYDIKMLENGLLWAGNGQHGLTWMDAMVNGIPVTPRFGLAVEINALWFNFLSFLCEIKPLLSNQQLDNLYFEIKSLLTMIRLHFCQTFYNEELGYLYDFVNSNQKNTDLRPNQIFAISLPYSALPKQYAIKVMQNIEQYLLTPYGLRTLSPQDAKYCGLYNGSQEQRDYAYHNGTVWPWLLGHFVEAMLKVHTQEYVTHLMQPCLQALTQHLFEDGIGGIAEIFSGDFPYKANGCINQAWSVAEVLRLTYLLKINF